MAVAVVETSVPVPVSSCARTASAARHSIHTGRDNMIAAVLNKLSRGGEVAGRAKQVVVQRATGKVSPDVCREFRESQGGLDVQRQQTITCGPGYDGSLLDVSPRRAAACKTPDAYSQGPCLWSDVCGTLFGLAD